VVSIAFRVTVDPVAMQYYYICSSVPMYAPSVVNALVALLMIGDYRRVLLLARLHFSVTWKNNEELVEGVVVVFTPPKNMNILHHHQTNTHAAAAAIVSNRLSMATLP
jgi:hypothetical protein